MALLEASFVGIIVMFGNAMFAPMGALSDTERDDLMAAIARRVGKRSDAAKLMNAYLDATHRHAFARTALPAPVPTTLNVERTALLVELSRALGRVIEDFEVEALFRVTASQARTMRSTLLATYRDVTDELTVEWSLRGAKSDGRREVDGLTGTAIRFTTEERRDAFAAQMARTGTASEILLGEAEAPWTVVVGDAFPADKLPPKAK